VNASSEEEEVIKVRVGSDGQLQRAQTEEELIDEFINSNTDL
jgi:hypothetical protein